MIFLAPVILSGAPHSFVLHEGEGRVVEGPRGWFDRSCSVREFSRECLKAHSRGEASPGSFDSPSSRAAGLGLAQDDRKKDSRRPYRRPNVSTSNLVSSEIIPSTPSPATRSIRLRSLTVQVTTCLPAPCSFATRRRESSR